MSQQQKLTAMQHCNIRINNASFGTINKLRPSLSLNTTSHQLSQHIQHIQNKNNPTHSQRKIISKKQKRQRPKQEYRNSMNSRNRIYSLNVTEKYNKNIAHPQTICFLNKHFTNNIKIIQITEFIDAILVQYEQLWGSENYQQIVEDFTEKVKQIFGMEIIQTDFLLKITEQQGMIGLIFNIFKQIREDKSSKCIAQETLKRSSNLQNLTDSFTSRLSQNHNIATIKNIVQQFMQSMYLCMQQQIYQQFNIQMKRMIIKYRQTSNILRKIDCKLNTYADIFELQAKLKKTQIAYKSKIKDLEQLVDRNENIIEKHKNLLAIQKEAKQLLIQQNCKLQTKLDNCNDSLLKIALNKKQYKRFENNQYANNFERANEYKQNYCQNADFNNHHTHKYDMEKGLKIKVQMDINNIHRNNKTTHSNISSNMPPRYSLSRF